MERLILKKCPQCNKQFQAARKNQLYCSTSCRTDANNVVAKERYATFKEEVPKLDSIKNQLKKVQEYISGLTLIIYGVEKIDRETLLYNGKKYKRGRKIGQPIKGITISSGGSVMIPGNIIIYRDPNLTGPECWEYILEKQAK